jgi:uncharacterized membrane protein (DUF373 family)
MLLFLKKFELFILKVLLVMIMVVVFVSTIELGWIVIKDLYNQPRFLLSIADLKEIFGFFLLVLIGIELLETIKAYLVDNVIHVEIILEVALIAIARKVIILDFEKFDGFTTMAIGALILAVAAAFYAVRKRSAQKTLSDS